jgi:hypothetical protein
MPPLEGGRERREGKGGRRVRDGRGEIRQGSKEEERGGQLT